MSVEWYVYWVIASGLIFNIWLTLQLGKVCGGLLYTAAAATSFTRFAWACGRVHGFRPQRFPRWMYAPSVWGSFFAASLGAGKGEVSHMGGAGVWNGIGNWTVYPRKEAEPCL